VLLSLSEHLSFFKAYLAAAATTIGMITLYTAAALKSLSRTAIVFVLLTSLYIVLYSLLRLENYALLMGTVLLVLVVMVLMYVTRHLDQSMKE
jgi:inner membrane protein